MTTERLPCGCPTVDSLFDLKGGGRALIVHPPIVSESSFYVIPAIVWCTRAACGWVDLTVEQFDEYSAVRG